MSKYEWRLASIDNDIRADLSLKYNISKICANILINRGILSDRQVKTFLDPYSFEPSSPFLIYDMQKAVDRIEKAIASHEKITIYGDYDVDGITSTALLCRYFASINADVSFYIPDRFSEGYGMNKAALQNIKNDGTSLVITVDCGITAIEECEFAKQISLDVIITDHHNCKSEIPDCCGVINPHYEKSTYPFTELAGVGVAFKLICALENNKTTYHKLLIKYSDIVAIGTIADIMPLTDENRIIVKAGLHKLSRSRATIGIMQLLRLCTNDIKNVTTTTIAFGIAPRLNAAGRIARADTAVKLLLTDDLLTADTISQDLYSANISRQKIEKDILKTALNAVTTQVDLENDLILVLACENCHHGIIGIVASRLCNIYKRPCILISTDNDIGKGSSRSTGKFDLYEALHCCQDKLVTFGGHKKAAGLTIKFDKIPEFRKAINEYATKHYTKKDLVPTLFIDCSIDVSDIKIETIQDFNRLEPFGNKNELPCFLLENVEIEEVISLSMGQHTKLILKKENCLFTALCFGTETKDFTPSSHEIIDIVCNLDTNEFKGKTTVQLKVVDYKERTRI